MEGDRLQAQAYPADIAPRTRLRALISGAMALTGPGSRCWLHLRERGDGAVLDVLADAGDGATVLLSGLPDGAITEPVAARRGDGAWVCAWRAPGGAGIQVALIRTGAPTVRSRATPPGTRDARTPRLALADSGGFIVFWECDSGRWGRQYHASGHPAGPAMQLAGTGLRAFAPPR